MPISLRAPLLLAALASFLFVGAPTWARSSEPTLCPDPSLGETSEDCPWAGITRELLEEIQAGKPVAPKLAELAPGIRRNLVRDSAYRDWRGLWGQSINFDELAKEVIVHPGILAALQRAMGVPVTDRIVHAGLEHTYGYLFSILKTSYGYKRARWVRGTIEAGLGLPGGVMGPTPQGGSLFSNATYLAGRIAFRDTNEELRSIASGGRRVAPALASYPFASLKVRRLEETLTLKSAAGKPRTVVLRTDLVAFRRVPPGQTNSHLLVYSVLESGDTAHPGARLVTLFPVETAFVDNVFNPRTLGQNMPIITRYNAFVDGVTGLQLKGLRKIAE